MAALRIVALAGACLALPTLASAQCRLCGQRYVPAPTSPAAADVELQMETSLSFDRVILSGESGGAATIRPDGSNGVEGSVIQLGPLATVGTILVHGEPNRIVRIDVPHRIQLFSLAGGQVTVDDVTTDVSAVTHLDGAGNLTIRFGGRIILSGDCDGPYRGDLPITVEYQ